MPAKSKATKETKEKTKEVSKVTKGQDKEEKKKGVRKEIRAETFFAPSRLKKNLKKIPDLERITQSSTVFLSGVLDYITSQAIDIASRVAISERKKKSKAKKTLIKPLHLSQAFRMDKEFNHLVKDTMLLGSGIYFPIDEENLKKEEEEKKERKKKEAKKKENKNQEKKEEDKKEEKKDKKPKKNVKK